MYQAARTPTDNAVIEDLFSVSPARMAAIRALEPLLVPGTTVALSTHLNADGDGCGSEAALARLLMQRGMRVRIVNPTPWPALFSFLLGDDVVDASARGAEALQGIDLLIVLDINDVRRLGGLADAVRALTVPIGVIDHHMPGDEPIGHVTYADTTACATGELVFDLARTLGLTITPEIAASLYCAILTDTGGFRFSNTSPRCHAVAAALLGAGVVPETMYRRIYAQVKPARLHLLREALGTLQIDADIGLSWLSLPFELVQRTGATTDDVDGLVEHPRSVAGTRLALMFRDLGHGKVKASFRSTGNVDVQELARQFGGGGHVKASGALLVGTLEECERQVIAAARAYLAAHPAT
jgi:phosphoesterase RecJ-like protein